MEKTLHVKALEIYREYLFVGGMPAAIDNFVRNRNPLLANIIKQDHLAAYQNDRSKYNKPREIAKTRLVYSRKQLAKEIKNSSIAASKPVQEPANLKTQSNGSAFQESPRKSQGRAHRLAVFRKYFRFGFQAVYERCRLMLRIPKRNLR